MLVKNRKKNTLQPTPHCKQITFLDILDPLNTKGNQHYSADASSTDFWLHACRYPRENRLCILSYHVEVLGCQSASTTSIYPDELTKESESLVNRLS